MVDGRLAILAFAVGLGVRDVSSHPGGLWLISLGCTGGPKWLSYWTESEPLENYEDRSTHLSMNDIIPRSILLLLPSHHSMAVHILGLEVPALDVILYCNTMVSRFDRSFYRSSSSSSGTRLELSLQTKTATILGLGPVSRTVVEDRADLPRYF